MQMIGTTGTASIARSPSEQSHGTSAYSATPRPHGVCSFRYATCVPTPFRGSCVVKENAYGDPDGTGSPPLASRSQRLQVLDRVLYLQGSDHPRLARHPVVDPFSAVRGVPNQSHAPRSG